LPQIVKGRLNQFRGLVMAPVWQQNAAQFITSTG